MSTSEQKPDVEMCIRDRYNAKVQAELAAQQKAIEAGEEPPAGELGAELPYLCLLYTSRCV